MSRTTNPADLESRVAALEESVREIESQHVQVMATLEKILDRLDANTSQAPRVIPRPSAPTLVAHTSSPAAWQLDDAAMGLIAVGALAFVSGAAGELGKAWATGGGRN